MAALYYGCLFEPVKQVSKLQRQGRAIRQDSISDKKQNIHNAIIDCHGTSNTNSPPNLSIFPFHPITVQLTTPSIHTSIYPSIHPSIHFKYHISSSWSKDPVAPTISH
mmetsp:Transcript_16040/g.30277  ORF Transcript_16040/g.30277 Transcript_16040/m.30277 type:complete len:108 (-) Transcript_16040:809-1132(-)